jgi:outer membrane protease
MCLFLPLSMTAQAGPPAQQHSSDNTFGFGLGYLNGNTLYHISSYDAAGSGIESELEFPLKTFLFGLEGSYISRNSEGKDTLKIDLQWFTNVDNGSGTLKDSDWLTNDIDIRLAGSAHPGKDIYSESDISLKANIIDIRAFYNFWPSKGLAVGPLGGFLYQNFQFNASNVRQVGYGPYSADYTGNVPGLVLTYKVTCTIPYVGIHSEMIVSKGFGASLDLGYSPLASAEDEDDHLLRYKRSKGSTTGQAYVAAVTAQWKLQNNNSFLLQGQYVRIDTAGTQTQTWYRDEATSSGTIPAGTVINGIDDKITSQQTSITFLVSHRF